MNDPITELYHLLFRLSQSRRRRRSTRLPHPVISVGSLSVGGSGKTPVAELLVSMIAQKERDPVLLSRGYGRRTSSAAAWFFGEARPDPQVIGDEPAMIAELMSRGAVIVGGERISAFQSMRERIERLENPVVILDDGFQHLQIERDLDLLVVERDLTDNTRLLPFGRLREPLEGAARADAVITIGGRPADLRGVTLSQWFVADTISGQPSPVGHITRPGDSADYLLVTGVARDHRILASLEANDVSVLHHLRFADHHRYSRGDVHRILSTARKSGTRRILTTRKDLVKLRRFSDLLAYLWVIPHGLEPSSALADYIDSFLQSH